MFGELKGPTAQVFYAIGLGSSILIVCAVIGFVGREAIKKQKLVEFFGTVIAFVALGISLLPFIIADKDKEIKDKELSDLKNKVESIGKIINEEKQRYASEQQEGWRDYYRGFQEAGKIFPRSSSKVDQVIIPSIRPSMRMEDSDSNLPQSGSNNSSSRSESKSAAEEVLTNRSNARLKPLSPRSSNPSP